jgi:hypothetical protein
MKLIREILGRVLVWLIQAIIGAVFLAFFVYLVFEWASGCGEHYVDSQGVTHTYECVFSKASLTNLQRLR